MEAQARSLGRIRRHRKQQSLVTSPSQELQVPAHVLLDTTTHILLSRLAFHVKLVDIALANNRNLRPIAVLDTGVALKLLRGRHALQEPRAQRHEQLPLRTVPLAHLANIAPLLP
jgi:hypothetical protein